MKQADARCRLEPLEIVVAHSGGLSRSVVAGVLDASSPWPGGPLAESCADKRGSSSLGEALLRPLDPLLALKVSGVTCSGHNRGLLCSDKENFGWPELVLSVWRWRRWSTL